MLENSKRYVTILREVYNVIANIGVIIGGGLVLIFDNRWPDIVIGSIIFLVIVNGAMKILRDVKNEEQIINS